MKPPPKFVSLSAEQIDVFMRELHRYPLDPVIVNAIEEVLRTYMWLIWTLQETKLSLKRFRQMVFAHLSKCLKRLKFPVKPQQMSLVNRPLPLRPRRLSPADLAAICRVRDVTGQIPMWEPNGSSVAMRT